MGICIFYRYQTMCPAVTLSVAAFLHFHNISLTDISVSDILDISAADI